MNKARIASLPMYDWPELHEATDAFWAVLRVLLKSEGIDAPVQLSRDGDDAAYWTAPDLLLGQTCGYPLATSLKDKVRYVSTPIYAVEGCVGPQYSSAIVVSRNSEIAMSSLAGRTFTYNSEQSLSGYRVMRAMFGELQGFFANTIISGGHRQSARLVASGAVEVAAIDAVCWHMLQQHEAETADRLRVVGWTHKRPSLPMITSLEISEETLNVLRDTLKTVALMPQAHALAITGFEDVPVSAYYALSSL